MTIGTCLRANHDQAEKAPAECAHLLRDAAEVMPGCGPKPPGRPKGSVNKKRKDGEPKAEPKHKARAPPKRTPKGKAKAKAKSKSKAKSTKAKGAERKVSEETKKWNAVKSKVYKAAYYAKLKEGCDQETAKAAGRVGTQGLTF